VRRVSHGKKLDQYKGLVAHSSLPEELHLMGHIAHDVLPNYFKARLIFCTPSTRHREAHGVATAQPILMDVFVVALGFAGSSVSPVDVDGEMGFVVQVGGAPGLPLMVARLVSDNDFRQRIGAASCHRYPTESLPKK